MRYADLSRYDDRQLESMLRSYSRIAEEHARSGHYALAKWANGMRVHITVEMNKRDTCRAVELDRQQSLFPNSSDR